MLFSDGNRPHARARSLPLLSRAALSQSPRRVFVCVQRVHPPTGLMLDVLLLLKSSVLAVVLEIDSARQPEFAENGRLDLRYRCRQSHVEPAITTALTSSFNYTGLGWSPDYVQPLIANLTGCLELSMSELHGPSSLPLLTPLAVALAVACPHVADPSRPWEPARSMAPLRRLDFEGSLLEDGGASALEPIIRSCPSVEAIHAPANRISDAGARAFAAGLASPAHAGCQILDLHHNLISDEGAEALARVLTVPVPLGELRLHYNRIGTNGFVLLAEGLRNNVLLHTLMLSGNPGGDVGVSAIANALAQRSSLRRLYLSATNITDVGATALLDALKEPNSPAIETLVLDGNPAVSESILSAIAAHIATHQAVAASEGSTGIFRVPS